MKAEIEAALKQIGSSVNFQELKTEGEDGFFFLCFTDSVYSNFSFKESLVKEVVVWQDTYAHITMSNCVSVLVFKSRFALVSL